MSFGRIGLINFAGGRFLKLFKTLGREPSPTAIEALETAMNVWRQNLPASFHADTLRQRTPDNVWVFVLLVESYRTECLFYRAVRNFNQRNSCESSRVVQLYNDAVFELNSLVERICAYGIVQYCPLSL